MRFEQKQGTISGIAVTLFVIALGGGAFLAMQLRSGAPVIAATVVGLYLLLSVKVADQWEKAAVLRFGRYVGLRGPGIFHIIPLIERLSGFVDQRVRVANVSARNRRSPATRFRSTWTRSCSGWFGTRRNRSSKWKTSCRRSR